MKLRTLILGAALGLPFLALADNSGNPFAGPFIGAGLGFTNGNVNNSIPATENADSGKGGVAGQLVAGFNYGLNPNWLIGAQAYYEANNIKITDTIGDFTVTGKMNGLYGIDALLGYAFNQTSMVFAGVGYVGSKLKLSGDISNSTTFNGWRGTFGAQQVLTGALSLRESLAYTGFSSKVVNSTANLSGKPTVYTSLVSLVYTFNT